MPASTTRARTSGPTASTPRPIEIRVWADRDDDDADGVPDGEAETVGALARTDLVPIGGRVAGAAWQLVSGGEHARIVLASGRPLPWTAATRAEGWIQGLTPGRVELMATLGGEHVRVTVAVLGLDLRGGSGAVVDLARSHASPERTPPARVEGAIDAPFDDVDALRALIAEPDEGPGLDSDREMTVDSYGPIGTRIDELASIALTPAPCARPYPDVRCWASAPLRLVTDDVDRNHPLAIGRSIKAEVGGAIVFRRGGRKAQMIRVLGPRTSPVGPIGRLRAKLRPFVVRLTPGGAPSIGGTDAGAVAALRGEIAAAAAVWGQCGVTFGDLRQLEIRVVDPPPSHLLAIGDDFGSPASGGKVRFRVGGRDIAIATSAGASPEGVADAVARALEHLGYVAIVSPNARIAPGIGPTADVSVRRRDGALVALDTVRDQPLSTDPTLRVRIGSVDLADGIDHFTDVDAVAGTLEERTLLKAIDDGDPTTVEIAVIPLFQGGGRIGESFIGSDLSSVRNVVLIDRAGIRARKSSLTVAHELGHVLMDLPGHPDDYGTDTPTLLMDSDAADASPFGPRRLTVDECARAVRQSGPASRVPLLASWPIGPLPPPAR